MNGTGAIRTLLPLLLLVLLVAGCGARQRGGADLESATVVVENQSWNQMRIYAVAGSGQRVRLGNVSGNRTERLRIPGHLIGIGRDVAFLADALAGGEARSFSIYVRPGDEVTITIPSSVR